MTDESTTPTTDASGRMPVVFVGHGSPMHALEQSRWSQGFAELGNSLPRPRAILSISAHWFVSGTYLTGDVRPATVHDFGGFPKALYEIEYPAPGKVELAERVRSLLATHAAQVRSGRGLDHGTWTVLKWMYPEADVPVVQLSLDRRLEPRQHHHLARSLTALRDEGVLVLGSGNITHNLRDAVSRMQRPDPDTPQWAMRFDAEVKRAVQQHDHDAVLSLQDSDDGRRAHPSPDHLWPLLYAIAATDGSDQVRFNNEGFDAGSLSMRNIIWGG